MEESKASDSVPPPPEFSPEQTALVLDLMALHGIPRMLDAEAKALFDLAETLTDGNGNNILFSSQACNLCMSTLHMLVAFRGHRNACLAIMFSDVWRRLTFKVVDRTKHFNAFLTLKRTATMLIVPFAACYEWHCTRWRMPGAPPSINPMYVPATRAFLKAMLEDLQAPARLPPVRQ